MNDMMIVAIGIVPMAMKTGNSIGMVSWLDALPVLTMCRSPRAIENIFGNWESDHQIVPVSLIWGYRVVAGL
jgi:hypothetical protein